MVGAILAALWVAPAAVAGASGLIGLALTIVGLAVSGLLVLGLAMVPGLIGFGLFAMGDRVVAACRRAGGWPDDDDDDDDDDEGGRGSG